MNNKQFNYVLLSLTILFIAISVIVKPNYTYKNKLKNEIKITNQKIKEQKHQVALTSPLKNNFDLQNAKQKANDNLYQSFTTLLGGIHDDTAYNAAKSNLQKTLGKDLENVLFMRGKNTESKKWVINKNDSTVVGFSNVSNKYDSIIYVVTTFEQGTDNQKIKYMYKLHYNLVNQKVLSYSEKNLN